MGIFSNIFSRAEKTELVLVFDIGSSSVGGALFETNPNGVPRIIFSIREPIVLLEQIDFDQFLSYDVLDVEIFFFGIKIL